MLECHCKKIMAKKKLIRIKATYLSKDLQQILGKKKEVFQVPQGFRSGDFFDFLQERYQEIFKKFGPGYLGFVLNGQKPHVLTLLKDGDHYKFITWTAKEILEDEFAKHLKEKGAIIELPKGKFKMPKWMGCTWRRVACGKDDCLICGRIKRDRQKHIEQGEDPDDMKSVFEDVDRNFKEVLKMIKKDCETYGIELTNIENIKEPPEPEEFPLYREIDDWRDKVIALLGEAYETEELWVETEAAADLSWYKDTIAAKIYRQLINKWHIEQGDEYGDFDYKYTKYVLGECLKILKKSLNELILLQSLQKADLIVTLARLLEIEKKILKTLDSQNLS